VPSVDASTRFNWGSLLGVLGDITDVATISL
jgi:hypothetical protein